MKKVHLTIPEPCHENWDDMTQADKGKFCASCKKNVIDFSSMNDRQLAEFFKKPKTGLCGHFREDQLDRDIPIYKKRIPWLRYFFQFTWPAMVWLLKSCGMKQSVKGVPMLDSPVKNESPNILQIQGDTTYSYSVIHPQVESFQMKGTPGIYYEDFEVNDKNTSGNNAKRKTKKQKVSNIQQKVFEDESKIDERLAHDIKLPEDPTGLRNMTPLISGGVMGGLSIRRVTYKVEQPEKMEIKKTTPLIADLVHVFPNPVHAGSLLTINSEHEEGLPAKIQLINSSGQQVLVLEPETDEKSTVLNIRIPGQLTGGVYFLRMLTREEKVVTKKILVQ